MPRQEGARPLSELINEDEPAWPLVLDWLRAGQNPFEVLPTPRARGEKALLALQVTSRSPLGAIALESGGILVDGGWLRILGAGCERMPGSLLTWNGLEGPPPEPRLGRALVIAHDAVGGFFALDGSRESPPNVAYAAQDALGWFDMRMGYSDFIHWAAHGDLAKFYADLRWPGWEADVAAMDLGRAVHFAPPLFTKEGWAVRMEPRSRRPVPLTADFTRVENRL